MNETAQTRRVDDKRPDNPVDWSDAPRFTTLGIAETWAVTVEAEGQTVLCIGSDHPASLDDAHLQPFIPTIQSCAQHLLAFVGAGPVASAAPAAQGGIKSIKWLAGDGWLVDRGLVYRLNDDGFNRDEINVAMVNSSRDEAGRNAAANAIRSFLATAAVERAPEVYVNAQELKNAQDLDGHVLTCCVKAGGYFDTALYGRAVEQAEHVQQRTIEIPPMGVRATMDALIEKHLGPAEHADLHNAIMNIRTDDEDADASYPSQRYAYKAGHRDARHAAAELVSAHQGEQAEPAQTLKDSLAEALHYPACWDTAAYPVLWDAVTAVYAHFKCSECTQAAPASPEQVQAERAQFQAHFMAEGWIERNFERYDIYDPMDERSYKSRHVADMWDGWSARAKLTAPSAAQVQAIPGGYVLMPKRLTAENGAKGALSGEFKEIISVTCHECGGSGDDAESDNDAECQECKGDGTIDQDVPVTWDTIKDIYRKAVELLAHPIAAEPAAPEQVPQGWREVLKDMRDASYTITQYPETADVVFDSVIDALSDLEQEQKKSAAAAEQMQTDAARDVLAERRRQIEEEDWSLERDDQYPAGELSQAAACYAYPALAYSFHRWPWAAHLWKPSDPRCNLVKAGALILAEIERIDRAATKTATNEGDQKGGAA